MLSRSCEESKMIEGTNEEEKVRNEDEMRVGIDKENVIYNSYVQTLRDI